MICKTGQQVVFTHRRLCRRAAGLAGGLSALLALTAACSNDAEEPAATHNTTVQEGTSTLPTSAASTAATVPTSPGTGPSASSGSEPTATNPPAPGSNISEPPSSATATAPTANPAPLGQGGTGGTPNGMVSSDVTTGGSSTQAQGGEAAIGGEGGVSQGGTGASGGVAGSGASSQNGGASPAGGAGGTSANEGWVDLFNGVDLEGWVANDGGRGDDSSLPIDEVFQVVNGEIHVYPGVGNGSAQVFGNLRNETLLSGSYTLHVEYKWGENKFAPRANTDRDAGILFHITGNDVDKVFPDSLEMQIGDSQAGEELYMTGDLWVLGVPTFAEVMIDGELTPVGGIGSAPHYASVHAENPHGEWNVCEIIVDGANSATYLLNGVEVHQLYNFTYDGEPLDEGFVSVQAEWAEIYYRNIRYLQQ